MNSNNLIPSSGGNEPQLSVDVVGVSVLVSKHIVEYFARYSVQLVAAGIKGVKLEIIRTKLTITYQRHQENANYRISIHEELGRKFSSAMDRVEGNPNIRPEIKKRVLQELNQDLDEMFDKIRLEIQNSQ